MERREWTINLVILLIGAVFIIESVRLGLGRIQRPGPGMLPLLAGGGLSLAALYALVRSLLAAKGAKERFFGRNVVNVIIILIGLVVYVFVLPWLGYLTGTFMLLMFLFRAGGFRRWGTIVLYALVTTVVTHVVFSHWLNLRFPRGILGF